jgi:hypothetical protein
MADELAEAGSWANSELGSHLSDFFIPSFSNLPEAEKRNIMCRFFETGQVCSAADLSAAPDTHLLMILAGADGFQPFKRRVHSTTLIGFRYVCFHIAPFEHPASLCLCNPAVRNVLARVPAACTVNIAE